jgi:predicted alpha/beta hydrolase
VSGNACSHLDLAIPARDGYRLAATLFRPEAPSTSLVVIHCATAVPRRFYRHFAGALAAAGYLALSYDYRGIGGSRPERMRGFEARMRDWALLDMAGVVDWVRKEFDPSRLFFVGHSVGGQIAGLLDNSGCVDGMVTVSAQSGYWALQGAEQKLVTALHAHLTLPLLPRLFGYMPWPGTSEDLPRGVALEWSGWCRDPQYLLGDETLPLDRFDDFRAPVLAYSIADDKWGTARSVDAMMKAYPNLERRHLVPSEAGLKSIGHFGYFRPGSSALWAEAVDWFNSRPGSHALPATDRRDSRV